MGRFGAKISALFKAPAYVAASDLQSFPQDVPQDVEALAQTENFSSIDTTDTDFDNLTSPGAQAEMNEDYMRGVLGLARDGAVLLTSPVFLPVPNSSLSMPPLSMANYDPVYFELPPHMMPMPTLLEKVGNSTADWTDLDRAAGQLEAEAHINEEVHSQTVHGGVPYKGASSDTIMRGWTTLILQNLPNDYSREMLVELLDVAGFCGKYDFVYLPVDLRRMTGLGYAFVNMICHDSATVAMSELNGFSGWKKNSVKVLKVDWCQPLQGLSVHVERYRDSPLMHPAVPVAAKPLLFGGRGIQVEFPPPTKKIQPPRMKSRGSAANAACRM